LIRVLIPKDTFDYALKGYINDVAKGEKDPESLMLAFFYSLGLEME
jgi:hypothetical protein